MFEQLTKNLSERQTYLRADRNQHTVDLRDEDPARLLAMAIPHIVKGLERKASLIDLAVSVGRRVRQKLGRKRNTVVACHTGWFVLIAFFELGILSYYLTRPIKKGRRSKHAEYAISVQNREALLELWTLVESHEEADLYPMPAPGEAWTSGFHSTGVGLVKKVEPVFLRQLTPEAQPLVFNALNKLGSTAWRVNTRVLEVAEFFVKAKDTEDNPISYKSKEEGQAKESLRMTVDATLKLARKHYSSPFYHLYNTDFRGRLYCLTSYLHEQSDDLGKAMVQFEKADPIGEDGLYWLLLHGANTFGHDKIPLDDRVEWSLQNWASLVDAGRNPTTNLFWTEAGDDKWCALAFCLELAALQDWVDAGYDQDDFPSALPLAIDGKCNGLQHLVAMSLDEVLAPHVGLVPQETPGDMYLYLGKKVQAAIQELEMQVPSAVYHQLDWLLEEIDRLEQAYRDAPNGSELKKEAWNALSEFRNHTRALREALFPVYWNRIKDPALWRKIVKRNTMTVGYGGTPFGFGEQIWEDTRSFSPYLARQEKLWSSMLGRLVHRLAREELPGPGALLNAFETLADRFSAEETPLSWKSPLTNFPVVQNYRKSLKHRTWLQHGDLKINATLESWEDDTLDKDSQRLGASPNLVHSVDAVHMTLVINAAGFALACIHDSFGCTAGNMNKLFRLVRETFVELYQSDPLGTIMAQLNSTDLLPKKGKLKLEGVLDADFAFV